MKKILFLVVLVAAACAPSKRTTTYTPRPRPNGITITDAANRELLFISQDGKTWTWSGTPEDVILELIRHANGLQQKLTPPPAPAKKVVKEAKK